MEGTGSIFSLEGVGGGDLEETEEEEVLGFCKLNSLPRLSNFHRQNQPKGEAEITLPESRSNPQWKALSGYEFFLSRDIFYKSFAHLFRSS